MTVEKKCFIRPEDIVSVQFQCAKCKASTTIPVGKLSQHSIKSVITQSCLHCGEMSGFMEGTQETTAIINFNFLLGMLSGVLKNRGIDYSLQTECSE